MLGISVHPAEANENQCHSYVNAGSLRPQVGKKRGVLSIGDFMKG